ncbi:MAG: DnaD domain protein [Mycoplasma sp.]
MNKLIEEKIYQIYVDFDFHANEKILNFIYSPILGYKAISVYQNLINMHAFQLNMGSIIKLNINSILSNLKMNRADFDLEIKKLEGLRLVETFIDQNKQNLVIFKLNEPLKWSSFSKNSDYMNILKESIGELEFEKRKYLFNQSNPFHGLVNISTTFENAFNIKSENTMNFDIVYDHMYKKLNKLVKLNDHNKAILNNAFMKYHFSYDEICSLISQSLIKNENEISINNELLLSNIKKLIDLNDNHKFNNQLKINRSNQIFLAGTDLEKFKYVISDYKTLNSEQYLSCIQKHALSEVELNTIKNLRKKYHLKDFMINILIDYCIFKNNGRIEPLYLNRIASTINRLNLDNVTKLITHLQSANQSAASKFKVEW